MKNLFLCCNQANHVWEILNSKNEVVAKGTLEEMEKKKKELENIK